MCDELDVGPKSLLGGAGGPQDCFASPAFLGEPPFGDEPLDAQPHLLVGHAEQRGDGVELAGVNGVVGADQCLDECPGGDLDGWFRSAG